MPVTVVVGAQWGDEGKGKVVDVLSQDADVIARYQGGPNAGHTIFHEGRKLVLHTIPSGILYDDKINIVGNGCVVNLSGLHKEMQELQACGVNLNRLYISERAHVILPYHEILDRLSANSGKIDTTGRGIGQAYESKVRRTGIRMCDFYNRNRLRELVGVCYEEFMNALDDGERRVLRTVNSLNPSTLAYEQSIWFEGAESHVANTEVMINKQIKDGARVLCEGAQGTLLDVDHGTYPFVTSSSSTAAGAPNGLGFSPKYVDSVIGVVKAYVTRVGRGPFPTELGSPDLKDEKELPLDSSEFSELKHRVSTGDATDAEMGRYLRSVGHEYGATTGRPRRTGWQDLVAGAYAARINGFNSVVLTKLDVLDSIPHIKAFHEYERTDGHSKHRTTVPHDLGYWTPSACEVFDGWQSRTSDVREYGELPDNARKYIEFLERHLDVPIKIVSTGPDREQTIFR